MELNTNLITQRILEYKNNKIDFDFLLNKIQNHIQEQTRMPIQLIHDPQDSSVTQFVVNIYDVNNKNHLKNKMNLPYYLVEFLNVNLIYEKLANGESTIKSTIDFENIRYDVYLSENLFKSLNVQSIIELIRSIVLYIDKNEIKNGGFLYSCIKLLEEVFKQERNTIYFDELFDFFVANYCNFLDFIGLTSSFGTSGIKRELDSNFNYKNVLKHKEEIIKLYNQYTGFEHNINNFNNEDFIKEFEKLGFPNELVYRTNITLQSFNNFLKDNKQNN